MQENRETLPALDAEKRFNYRMTATSQIVLPAAAILATILVGLATVWVTYAVGFTRRRLLYRLPAVAPALNVSSSGDNDIQFIYQGTVLKQPYVMWIQLIAQGRKDIPSTAFDGGRPLRLDVNANIIQVLQVTSNAQQGIPKTAVNGSVLEVGPGLIGRHQQISIALLVDGAKPYLVCQSSLENVDVKQLRAEQFRVGPEFIFGAGVGMEIIGIAVLLAGLLPGFFNSRTYMTIDMAGSISPKAQAWLNSAANAGVVTQLKSFAAFVGVVGIAFGVISIIWALAWRRKLGKQKA